MDQDTRLGIEVRRAYKSYRGNEYVLRGLDLNVQKGTIYSLLGPSGCGKTTLLRCIVGLEKLTSGKIGLITDDPRTIGYMPQEISLLPICTIGETFNFYGTLYGLNDDQVQERIDSLSKLLNLPEPNLRVGQLSGGEQRRMSFAVTLFHSPDLIILDEPTVGLDPILHDSVWQNLLSMASKQEKTIIITTHYIEEAKHSHRIGMMRDGLILDEERPAELMVRTNCNTLEGVFLQLCNSQKKETLPFKPPLKIETCPSPISHKEHFNYHRFKAQLKKDYIWAKRNIVIMFFLLILPASQSFLFCWSFGRYPKTLALGIFSEERGARSCSRPEATLYYSDEGLNCTLDHPMTCFFRHQLEKSLTVINYDRLEEGVNDTYRNRIWGIIHFGENFTEALLTKMNMGLYTFNDAIEQGSINVRMDMSSYIITHQLRKRMVEGMQNAILEMTDACGIPQLIGKIPISFEKSFYEGDPSVGGGSELAGFIIGFCFYFGLMFTSGALLNEKLSGVLHRNLVSGLTLVEIVAAHMFIQVLLLTFQAGIMVWISYSLFEYAIAGSPILVMAILYTVGFVGVALGVLMTNLFTSSVMQTYAVIGSTITVFNMGGVIWPQEGIHFIIRSWIWAVPTVPAVDSLRAVVSKGHKLSSPTVYIGLLSCYLWIFILILVTVVIVKYKKTI